MSFTSRKAALDIALAYLEKRGANQGDSAWHSAQHLTTAAEEIHGWLTTDGDPWESTNTGSGSPVADQLAAIRSDLERLINVTVSIEQASADFQAAIQADTDAKNALKQQVADLQTALAAAQAADASDVAARDAALAQVQDAANALEQGAQALNPLPAPPAPTDGGGTPAPTDGGGTPAPTDGSGDTTPAPTDGGSGSTDTPAPTDGSGDGSTPSA